MWKKCHSRPTCTKVLPAQIHPTKCMVNEQNCEYIVPEVHPSHVTNITNHHYKHIHSFPQTQSFQENITHQHFVAPAGMGPSAMGPGGMPSQVSPAGMAPTGFPSQMSPAGMGPNGFPTQVSPANMGPNQMAPGMMGPRPPMGKCCGR